jgi:hypothetical protein
MSELHNLIAHLAVIKDLAVSNQSHYERLSPELGAEYRALLTKLRDAEGLLMEVQIGHAALDAKIKRLMRLKECV